MYIHFELGLGSSLSVYFEESCYLTDYVLADETSVSLPRESGVYVIFWTSKTGLVLIELFHFSFPAENNRKHLDIAVCCG